MQREEDDLQEVKQQSQQQQQQYRERSCEQVVIQDRTSKQLPIVKPFLTTKSFSSDSSSLLQTSSSLSLSTSASLPHLESSTQDLPKPMSSLAAFLPSSNATLMQSGSSSHPRIEAILDESFAGLKLKDSHHRLASNGDDDSSKDSGTQLSSACSDCESLRKELNNLRLDNARLNQTVKEVSGFDINVYVSYREICFELICDC